jgi:beta-lactamase regulating signal transducer with metallopeptidase domain
MNHHLESLGWTLVHFCWQAVAIALVYWLTDAVLSKARSQTRYVLALGTMLLMLVSALATFAYEETRGDSGLLSSAGAFSSPAMMAIGSSVSSLAGLKTAGAAAQPSPLHLSRFLPWLDVAWLLGVACLSTRTMGGWRLIQRLRRSALVEAPEAVYANFVRLCERLGITQQVSLSISQHIQGPLAIGVVRSLVILPASALMALTPAQLEAVLAHELAHVRRADYLWNLIQTMVETLLFFHPAVWWLGSRLRQQRELCCDDVAVQSCADPLVYATALLRLEERRSQRLSLAMALDGHKPWSGLGVRIARILGETNGEKSPRELVPIPLAAICALFLLVLLPMPHLFAGLRKNVQAQTTPPAVSAPPLLTNAPKAMNLPAPVVSSVVHDASPVLPRVQVAFVPAAANDGAAAIATEAQGTGQGTGEGAGSGAGNGSGGSGGNAEQAATVDAPAHKPDYIDAMRAAGYDVDIDKYVAMKVQGITPEYAQAMAKVGFGKPTADDLIAMKVQGVTPEYVSELRTAGLQPSSIHDLVSYRIFKVTPEFVAAMKAAGFDSIPPDKLVALRVHNVTPEYAKTVKQQYPNVTLDELVQLRIFHIDDAFIAAAKRHGFNSLSIEQLVQLRISGVMGDSDAPRQAGTGEAK